MASIKKLPKAKKWLRSDRYINREYSWIQFNSRVLDEAENPKNPLLERLKFLAIFESNLDEFYMVRVSGLIEQQETGIFELSPDGLSPSEQLKLIARTVVPERKRAGDLWQRELQPLLAQQGVVISDYAGLPDRQRHAMDRIYKQEVFPVCTPLLLNPVPSFPFISSRSLNLAVVLQDEIGSTRLARVKIPTVVPRAMRVHRRRYEFVLLEDMIQNNLQSLFPGVTILASYRFRVIRDADIEIRELEAEDLIDTIEKTIRARPTISPKESQSFSSTTFRMVPSITSATSKWAVLLPMSTVARTRPIRKEYGAISSFRGSEERGARSGEQKAGR